MNKIALSSMLSSRAEGFDTYWSFDEELKVFVGQSYPSKAKVFKEDDPVEAIRRLAGEAAMLIVLAEAQASQEKPAWQEIEMRACALLSQVFKVE